jgi:hypothetical protein
VPHWVDARREREGQGAAACQRRQSVQPVSVGSRCSLSVPKGCLDRGCDGERLRRFAALSFCIPPEPCRLSPRGPDYTLSPYSYDLLDLSGYLCYLQNTAALLSYLP